MEDRAAAPGAPDAGGPDGNGEEGAEGDQGAEESEAALLCAELEASLAPYRHDGNSVDITCEKGKPAVVVMQVGPSGCEPNQRDDLAE